tara:strand:- start:72 stop:674 length:603 start_codon:yes stop_codon:yes gene_type:complete
MVSIKKGAMFGLDARIALAIFGALSVISGAALYSAIQDAKVTAIITELDELDKATTAYLLDTGSYLAAEAGADKATLNGAELRTSSATGWQGPYIAYAEGSSSRLLKHSVYGDIAIVGGLTGNWSDAEAASGAKCLTSSSTCATFTCFKGVSLDIQQAVEKRIDGGTPGATNNAGSIRYAGAGKYLCKQGAVFPVTSAVN